eukprot:COSAG01_NODE_56411_length_318_cov_1.584475_1_plen_21_part_10
MPGAPIPPRAELVLAPGRRPT